MENGMWLRPICGLEMMSEASPTYLMHLMKVLKYLRSKVKCKVNRITNLSLECKTDAQTRDDHRAVFSVHKGCQINIWSETKKGCDHA